MNLLNNNIAEKIKKAKYLNLNQYEPQIKKLCKK